MNEQEKAIYSEIGSHLQIERGQVHPDQAYLKAHDVTAPDTIDRNTSTKVFNQLAAKQGLPPITDPKGYQKLDDNVYDMLHRTYQAVYTKRTNQAEDKLINGGPYAFRAMLDRSKMNGTIQKEIRTYLPKGTQYSDLKYVKNNPVMEQQATQMFEKRADITNLHNIRRSVEAKTFEQTKQEFQNWRDKTVQTIDDALQGKTAQLKLSKRTLLENSGNNAAGLLKFAQMTKNPPILQPDAEHPRARAQFAAENTDEARFLLQNKDYLQNFGFNVQKEDGAVKATWESPKIDALAKQQAQRTPDLNLDDLQPSQPQR